MLRVSKFGLASAAALLAFAGPLAYQLTASGVGASLYVPGRKPAAKVQQVTHTAPVVVGCVECERQGFACMAHLGVTPCTAEGACRPSPEFGYTQTRWRKWPGVVYDDGRRPRRAADSEKDGGLLPDVDEPAPTEEDKQAPPPIDESAGRLEGEAAEGDGEFQFDGGPQGEPGGGFEFDLPAAPGGIDGPFQPPRPVAPGFRDQPAPPAPGGPAARPDAPPLPPFDFGGGPRRSPVAGAESPRMSAPTRPAASRPTPASADAPPPLPVGFTQAQPGAVRSLPSLRDGVRPRYDAAVQPVSAVQPAR